MASIQDVLDSVPVYHIPPGILEELDSP